MSAERTYAEALYEAAADAGAVEPVAADLAAFADAVRGSDELRAVLADPKVDRPAKKRVVGQLTEDAHPLVANFLQVLIDRDRLDGLDDIAEAFGGRVARAQNRIEVEAVTAIPLPVDLRERIIEQIREKTGAAVDLTESVDPDIVGGLVLRVGASVVDGSLRHRIEELRSTLRAAPVDAATVAS